MSEQLLTVLKLCLLALLYLFFLRVLRAVWTEVNPPRLAPADAGQPVPVEKSRRLGRNRTNKAVNKTAKPRRGAPSVASRLVLIEPEGRAGLEFGLDQELTVGRAAGCSIVLDEQYVSQVHTRIFIRDGSVFVEDLGSTNGTWVNGNRAVGQMPARLGDHIQIGNVVMEVR